MSSPSFAALGPPPLPSGWTEHPGPGGHLYYYNSQTQESTYVRPLPPFFPSSHTSQPPQKKEKPLVKTAIPGTDWLRVRTTEGNTFYSHKIRKESVWTVPEDIEGDVKVFEQQERERDDMSSQNRPAGENELEVSPQDKREARKSVKRKVDHSVPLEEVEITKKAKVEEEEEEEESNESDTSEEEDWQREAAAQLAEEAAEERKRVEEEARRVKEAEAEVQRTIAINIPQKVDLSLDEAKALFKTLLREKDINPLLPWDACLPQFVSDPRYILLPSVAVRREAFDEFCRDRARELRRSDVEKEKRAANPAEEYERLLKEEVKSTRTSWTDFRRMWKKDRRFYGWGRDDREREKRFREFLRELGEQKRAAAQKAEVDFFSLLKEHQAKIRQGALWKEIKKSLSGDPRYDAVASSSLREELYNAFMKGTASELTRSEELIPVISQNEVQESHQGRKERAVKEREEKVKAELGRLKTNIERSKFDSSKAEGERIFMTLLTDAIHDPQMTWEGALPQLQIDPRFTNSPLPLNQQIYLFHSHISRIRSKHLNNLRDLFQYHALSLATSFSDMPLQTLLSSLPATKLGYDVQQLEQEFSRWQRERTQISRQAFNQMLTENAFVEFWGRLSKIGGEGVDCSVKIENEDIGEDEDQSGASKVDMKSLAKNIDIREMEKVLKNDKRFIVFDHLPEEREKWLRGYLSGLAAPKLSVHTQS